MSQHINKIVKNSFYLYIRMFLLMGIGLYTSRVVLDVLGIEDYGIYNVVGSIVLILDFVSSSLTNSSQRYLNIGLGKGDIRLTNEYFSQSVGLHFLLSIVIVLLSETIGLWFLETKLNIPESRRLAIEWVFQLSVLLAFLKVNMICFQSVIIARENMSVYAYLSIFEGVAKLIIMYLIVNNMYFDKLVYYALLLVVIQVLVFVIHIVYCYKKYPESHYNWYWNDKLYKEMRHFVGVNIFGYLAWAGGNQGINIILNLFFGPIINAAKGLADIFERLFEQVVNNVFTAIKPRIVQTYAKGEIEEMTMLAEKATIYIYYVVLIVSLPLILEMEIILKLWLTNVPAYTESFACLMILKSYFWMLPIPYNQIAIAKGKIKNIQLYGRLITLLSLPVSYWLLLYGKNPALPVITVIVMSFFFWLYTIYDVSKQLEISLYRYFRNVILPISSVTICLWLSLFFIQSIMEKGYLRLFSEGFSCLILGLFFVCFIGMPRGDLLYLRKVVVKKFYK